MWPPKSTAVPVIVRALGIIQGRTDKHTNVIPDNLRLYEIQKLRFVKLFISFGEYFECNRKIPHKIDCKNYKCKGHT